VADDKIDVQINNRKFTIELEGLTPLEARSVASMVEDRINAISKETNIVDSSKLAIKAALEFAAELYMATRDSKGSALIDDQKLDGMIVTLEKSLGAE